MEQITEHKNTPTHIESTDLPHEYQKYTIKKRQPVQQMMLGNQDIVIQKDESGLFSFTVYKNQIKRDARFEYQICSHKTLRKKMQAENFLIQISVKATKAKTIAWSCIRLKQANTFTSICYLPRRDPKVLLSKQKIFSKHMTDKRLIFKICKELLKPSSKKTKIVTLLCINRRLLCQFLLLGTSHTTATDPDSL